MYSFPQIHTFCIREILFHSISIYLGEGESTHTLAATPLLCLGCHTLQVFPLLLLSAGNKVLPNLRRVGRLLCI